MILLSNQTSQTWQWKIPAFTDDFPNSTYTFRRFSIAMFVDHKVLLFFCFVFFVCACVCVSYWVLAGKAKVRRTSPKKGYWKPHLGEGLQGRQRRHLELELQRLEKNGVDMGSRRENMGVWVNNQFYNMFLLHSERF